MNNTKLNLLFSGELPPNSINGISLSNSYILKLLSSRFNIFVNQEVVSLDYHSRFSLFKLFALFKRLIHILWLSFFNKFDFFYLIFSNSIFGCFKTFFVLFCFKIFNFKTKCIIHIHRGDFDYDILDRRFQYILSKSVFFFCDKIIVLSHKTKDYILQNFHFTGEIIVLENTVFEEKFISKFISKKDHISCVFVSNYLIDKGILVLLDSFKRLNNNFRLTCYGNFPDSEFKNRILEYQCSNINIFGPIVGDEKFEIISNADVIILPSYNEGKPIVLLEAMMLGTPFITSNVGFIRELVDIDYPLIMDNVGIDFIHDKLNYFNNLTIKERTDLSKKLIHRYHLYYNNETFNKNIFKIFR